MSITRWNFKVPNYGVGKVLGYINATGDIEAITVSSSALSFPLSNVVFVDKDAATLSAQGMLAYATLEDAVDSWRPAGDAFAAYGAPSAINRGLILVGMGIFVPAGTIAYDGDLEWVDVVGCTDDNGNHEISASIAGPVIAITTDNVRFVNLRCSNLNTSNGFFSADNGITANSLFENIDFTSSTGAFVTGKVVNNGAGILAGTFRNCKMPCDAPGSTAFNWIGQAEVLWEDLEIVFNPGGGNFISLGGGGFSSTSTLRRIRFTGSSGGNGGFFNSDGATFSPTIEHLSSEVTNGLFFLARANGGTMNPTAKFITGTLNGGFAINATFTGLFDAGFTGILEYSKVINVGTNGHALSVGNGARVRHSILIGNGTGRAVNGAGTTIEANLNTVRNPTGDVAGSWTDATLAPPGNQYNAEILAAATS